MKIEFKTSEVIEQSGTSRRTGKDYRIRKQVGWLYSAGEPYPQRFEFQLSDDQEPFAPGIYETADELFVDVRNFSRLSVSRSMRLVPVAARKVA